MNFQFIKVIFIAVISIQSWSVNANGAEDIDLIAGGGGGIDPSKISFSIEDMITKINELNLDQSPWINFITHHVDSPSVVIKFDPSNFTPVEGVNVIAVDPAVFMELNGAMLSNPNQVFINNNGYTRSFNQNIHTDEFGRFLLLEADKSFDALAKDLLITPALNTGF